MVLGQHLGRHVYRGLERPLQSLLQALDQLFVCLLACCAVHHHVILHHNTAHLATYWPLRSSQLNLQQLSVHNLVLLLEVRGQQRGHFLQLSQDVAQPYTPHAICTD